MMGKSKESKNKSTIVSILYVLAIITLIFGVLISVFFGVTLHSRLLQEYGYIPSWYVLFITVLQATRKHFIFAMIFFAIGIMMDIRESKRCDGVQCCGKMYRKKPENEMADFGSVTEQLQENNSDAFLDEQVATKGKHNHADI